MPQLKLVRSFSFQMPTLELLSQGTELHSDIANSCFVNRNYWEGLLSQSLAFPCLLVLIPADQATSHWSCALDWHLLTLSQHLANSSCTVSTSTGRYTKPQTAPCSAPHCSLLQPWEFPNLRWVEFGTGLATLPFSPSATVSAVPDLTLTKCFCITLNIHLHLQNIQKC